MQKIGYLGPEGTFSQQAAQRYAQGKGTLVAGPTIKDVLKQVQAGTLDLAVIPMENSLEGAVNQSLDILAWEVDLNIQGELTLPVKHNLIVNKGDDWRQLHTIYTHPQAGGQCRKFLETELPAARIQFTYSTAEGAHIAKQNNIGFGAIAPAQAAELFGLQVAVSNIQDADNNCTRFAAVGKGAAKPSGKDKTSIIFSTDHKPGSLYRVLDIFSLWDINMTKIESRPAREQLGSYIFFVDIEGHVDNLDVADALTMVRRKTTFFKFLGSYPSEK
ncbi:MAG TPA: prephenate dehydratase [Verrucomicrobiae bacterium]|nr:prephenate dehydratase [Verrucomicrobiae bacterium]